MLMTIAIVAFLVILLANFFLGLWNNVLTLCNILIAALFASSFFETAANTIESLDPTFTYVADFLGAWGLFFVTFVVLRLLTDTLSTYKLELHPAFDYAGRIFVLLAAAWIFVSFAMFTMHMAPAKAELFAGGPEKTGPDRLWLQFMHSRSKGALADFQSDPMLPEYDEPTHPDDGEIQTRVFDPNGDFIYKYRHRRKTWSEQEQLRVYREE